MNTRKLCLKRIVHFAKGAMAKPICVAMLCFVLVGCISRDTQPRPTAQQISDSLKAQGKDAQTAQNMGEALAKGIVAVEYRPEDIQAAMSASKVFYDRMSAEQYATIYDVSADVLKAATSRDVFIGFLKRVNLKVGSCSEPKLVLTTAGKDDERPFVEFRFTRNCATVGEIQEKLSWSIVDGKPLLRSYYVFNAALLTD